MIQSVEVKYQMGATAGTEELAANANQAASESISAVRVVQSYNLQTNVIQRYVHTMEETNKQVSKKALAIGFAAGFAAFMMFSTYALVIFFGGHEIVNGWTSFDNMVGRSGGRLRFALSLVHQRPSLLTFRLTRSYHAMPACSRGAAPSKP